VDGCQAFRKRKSGFWQLASQTFKPKLLRHPAIRLRHPLHHPIRAQRKRSQTISHLTPCFIWWPLLGLNQRPSDYESQFEMSKISNLLIFKFSLCRIVMKSGT